MEILKHGNEIVNIPEMIEVFCPECAYRMKVRREICHRKDCLDRYYVEVTYKVTCPKCKCMWTDTEKKVLSKATKRALFQKLLASIAIASFVIVIIFSLIQLSGLEVKAIIIVNFIIASISAIVSACLKEDEDY